MKVWLQKHDHPYNLVSKYLVNMEVQGVGMDRGGQGEDEVTYCSKCVKRV